MFFFLQMNLYNNIGSLMLTALTWLQFDIFKHLVYHNTKIGKICGNKIVVGLLQAILVLC